MQDAWQNPSAIAPVKVLRMVLRGPLTLGHVMLLDELDSSVVRGEAVGLGDLAVAALVCAFPPDKARAMLRRRRTRFALRVWGSLCGRLDFAAETSTFVGWFVAQCGGPSRVTKKADGKTAPPRNLAAPWYVNKLASAMGELHLSESEACAMPIKRLNQLLSALAESRGHAEFWTDEQDELWETARRMDMATLEGKP